MAAEGGLRGDQPAVHARRYSPAAYPIRSNADDAWQWYAENSRYVTSELPERHGWRLLPPGTIET